MRSFDSSKESSLKVATTRAELHKIQHKSIQVVAEGIGLENYLSNDPVRWIAICFVMEQRCFPKMLGPAVNRGKDTTHKSL